MLRRQLYLQSGIPKSGPDELHGNWEQGGEVFSGETVQKKKRVLDTLILSGQAEGVEEAAKETRSEQPEKQEKISRGWCLRKEGKKEDLEF